MNKVNNSSITNQNSTIAVLIPCHNEAATIVKVIEEVRNVMPSDTTIYVYNNNSTDDTAQLARNAGAVVRKENRQGKGNVLRSMFHDIDAECYLMIDGDDTYAVDVLPLMCQCVLNEGFDMVIGDRLSTTYSDENKRPFHTAGNKIVSKLINRLFKGNIKDIMSGCRAMSRNFVKNLPILKNGFEIETEMTIYALDNNYMIKQIPITYRDRPLNSESKLHTFNDGYKIIKTILTLFVVYKPLVFFSSIAILLLIIAAIALFPVFMEYFQTGLVPRFPTLFVGCTIVIMSLLSFMCGIILEVANWRHRQLLELLSKS
ncbi:MAG: glycosyltransferase [Muribaculaceae bacterium]|nr:glycosyltransferase [Muribaculaceae bacterium]